MNNSEINVGALDATACLSTAWEAIKPNYALFLGMTVVMILLLMSLGCVPIVGFILAGPLTCGIYYASLKQLRGEPVDFGMIFKGFEFFVPAMIAGLVISAPYIVNQIIDFGSMFATLGAFASGDAAAIEAASAANTGLSVVKLVFFLVGLILTTLFFFAYPLVVDRKVSAIDALKLSFSGVSKNLGGVIVLLLLEGLLAIAGTLALCIGIFFVLPVIFAANAEAYRQVFPQLEPQMRSDIPPSPSEYSDLNI